MEVMKSRKQWKRHIQHVNSVFADRCKHLTFLELHLRISNNKEKRIVAKLLVMREGPVEIGSTHWFV